MTNKNTHDEERDICDELINIPGDCIKETYAPTIVKREGRSSIRFINSDRERVFVIKVDGCLEKGSERKRVDYLFIGCKQNRAYLVELKGSDLERAYEQIKETLEILKEIGIHRYRLDAYIVLTRTPTVDIRSSKRKALEKCFEKWGGIIKSNNNEGVITY